MAGKTGLESIASNLKAYSVPVLNLRLNPLNQRSEYGDFPKELAELVVNSDVLTEEQISEVKDALNSSDASNDKSLSWLVKSVIENGVQEFVRGYYSDGLVIVTAGNRRTTAAHIAIKVFGVDEFSVPFKAENQRVNESELLLRQFVENSGKKDFAPIETANLLHRLLNFHSIEELSRKTSLPVYKIDNYVGLLSLSSEAQKAIAEGSVKVTPVLNVFRDVEASVNDPLSVSSIVSDAIIEAATEARLQGKTKATEGTIKAAANKRITKPKNELDKDSLIDELQTLLENPTVLDSLSSEALNGILKKIKKEAGL